ncbi:hypothetical protein [Halorubrum trapanicum]|uniref:hypothetical protein n=1 Tax=Halorubrum trapanicum TaxID=29284 RepID=UPI0012FD3664|nr:hypothetical protein [Halorubrum trapanicum]
MNSSISFQEAGNGGSILIHALNHQISLIIFILLWYILLHFSSTWVVNYVFRYAGVEIDDDQKDTGTAIGKLENILILTLMLIQAYTALGVIFAAKSIVRADDIDTGDTSYYLTGTIANFTYSIVMGVLLHILLLYLTKTDIASFIPT